MTARSGQKILVALVAAASLGATALVAMNVVARRGRQQPEPSLQGGPLAPDGRLPVLATLPDFNLVERTGRKITLADFRGKVWIASFIYTRCPGPCPLITAQMTGLQKRLAGQPGWDRLLLATFTVDPQNDTPEVLRDYAQRYAADPGHWLMLTGEKKEVWPLVRTGFKLAVGDAPPDAAMAIMHSSKFVLVDAQARVRGYYDGLEAPDRDRLLRDARQLLDEPAPQGRP